MMLDVLGKPNAPLPVIMPARIAATPADQRIPEPIGSGPFRFVKSEWRPGNSMLLERNPDYVPRKEAPDFLAGGKNVKIDQLTLRVMPDQSTGANALIAGEIDYMQYLPFDMLPILEAEKSPQVRGPGRHPPVPGQLPPQSCLRRRSTIRRFARCCGSASTRMPPSRPSACRRSIAPSRAIRSGCAVRRCRPTPALPATSSISPRPRPNSRRPATRASP